MVVVGSPEWLPPGFTVKIKRKYGKKFKYFINVVTGKKYNSKKEVIRCATEDNSLLVTPQTKNGDDNLHSSINKVDVISDKLNDSAAWLPNGWMIEERKKKSGLTYKVYTDLTSGRKFYSKVAVTRYLSAVDHSDMTIKQNKIDNVDEPRPDKSPQVLPMTSTGNIHRKKRKTNSFAKIENVNELIAEKLLPATSVIDTGGVHEHKRKGNSLVMIDNVGEPFPDASSQVISKTNTDGIRGMKGKRSPYVTVSVETTTPDDLPSGWIKEIRTSMSGSKTRKDPFYIDPTSGYIFRSKPDVLRYLNTNDIRSCSIRPRKRDLDDIFIENKTPSSNPASEKLSMHKKHPFPGEVLNAGLESAGMKIPAELNTKISKRKRANRDSAKVEEKISCENSKKDAEIRNNPKLESDLTENGANIAISSPATDLSTKQQIPESGRNKMGSRKPKKRSGSSLPLRKSKRLADSEPEIQSHLDLNEPSTWAATEEFTGNKIDASPVEASDSMPQTSYIEPANKAIASECIPHTCNIEPANKVIASDSILLASNIDLENEAVDHAVVESHKVEQPPTESLAIPKEPSSEKASEKPFNDDRRPHESQLCYDFGDSWSDPLEFALKTLTGEMPVDDNLTFSSCFGQQLDTPCLNQSQFEAPPISFPSEISKKPESSKYNAADPLPASSSTLSAVGNIDFNFQLKSESSMEQNAVDPLPASSPTRSVLGNIDFGFNYQPKPASPSSFFSLSNFSLSSHNGFNYQPSKEAGKKDSQTKFNP